MSFHICKGTDCTRRTANVPLEKWLSLHALTKLEAHREAEPYVRRGKRPDQHMRLTALTLMGFLVLVICGMVVFKLWGAD